MLYQQPEEIIKLPMKRNKEMHKIILTTNEIMIIVVVEEIAMMISNLVEAEDAELQNLEKIFLRVETVVAVTMEVRDHFWQM